MSEVATKTYTDFLLPPSVVSRVDISRLLDEIERIDNEQMAATVRAKVAATPAPQVVLSKQLTDFLAQNKLAFDTAPARKELITQMHLLKDKAPVIHMTFAVVADQESLQQLVAWLRSSVHAQAVIEVGLQPSLVAGVHVRTPNHIHDMSVRGMLESRHGLLVKGLEALHAGR